MKLTNGNRVLEIKRDDHPESPREWDNLGTIVYGHRRYHLGDVEAWDTEDYLNWNDWRDGELKGAIALPVYLYDHSGLTINTTGFHCPWDSGQVGWIYVDKEKAREELGVKRIGKHARKRILDILRSEVELFDQYLRGDVYGFVLYEDGEEIDSCWGFYSFEDIVIEYPEFKEEVEAC